MWHLPTCRSQHHKKYLYPSVFHGFFRECNAARMWNSGWKEWASCTTSMDHFFLSGVSHQSYIKAIHHSGFLRWWGLLYLWWVESKTAPGADIVNAIGQIQDRRFAGMIFEDWRNVIARVDSNVIKLSVVWRCWRCRDDPWCYFPYSVSEDMPRKINLCKNYKSTTTICSTPAPILIIRTICKIVAQPYSVTLLNHILP